MRPRLDAIMVGVAVVSLVGGCFDDDDAAPTTGPDAATADASTGTGDGGGGVNPADRPTHCLLVEVGGTDTWLLREDGSDRIVLSGVTGAQYTADGIGVLYGKDGTIRRVDRDGTNDREVLAVEQPMKVVHPSESPAGDRFAYVQEEAGVRSLRIKPYSGEPQSVSVSLPGESIESVGWPRWSPTGERIALWFETRDGNGDNIKRLLVVNPDGTDARIVTTSQTDLERGDWTPDGARLVHETDDKSIGWTDVSTQLTTKLVSAAGGSVDDPVVSASGDAILYRYGSPGGGSELRLARLAGGSVNGSETLLADSAELAPVDWNPACK